MHQMNLTSPPAKNRPGSKRSSVKKAQGSSRQKKKRSFAEGPPGESGRKSTTRSMYKQVNKENNGFKF